MRYVEINKQCAEWTQTWNQFTAAQLMLNHVVIACVNNIWEFVISQYTNFSFSRFPHTYCRLIISQCQVIHYPAVLQLLVNCNTGLALVTFHVS